MFVSGGAKDARLWIYRVTESFGKLEEPNACRSEMLAKLTCTRKDSRVQGLQL